MGTEDPPRRAAGKKAREPRHRHREGASAGHRGEASAGHRERYDAATGGTTGQPPPEERLGDLLRDAVTALRSGSVDHVERRLDQLTVEDPALVDPVLADAFQRVVGRLWQYGWLPADLVRVVRRRHGNRAADLVITQIVAQLHGYPATTVPQRWQSQLREWGITVGAPATTDHRLTAWSGRQRLDRSEALRDAVNVLAVLTGLPEIGRISPLPGTLPPGLPVAGADRSGATTARAIDERVLGRVRGLLAKAESTEFPQEAEALSAKAQQLMARHSIDHALLDLGTDGAPRRTVGVPDGTGHQPLAVRIGVDSPYEQAKALLLQEVAAANRCRSVWSGEFGFATVLGFPSDVESVELIYTSLLVQATAAMVRGGSRGGSTGRSYRQSFLQAYAVRIGQRLRDAADAARREAVDAAGSDRLLPVLAAREDVVRETVDAMFPGIVERRVRGNDAAGWAAGTAAADRVALADRSAVTGASSGGGGDRDQ
ncbi:DUF2786 domain-containing protein [Micromonospora polyrhachis]|uniref:DUF2786 domain-containing protein n=1 Tax=Micromonospora polyrhachis TaxID=1282883 RepID=A0A7W7SU31_9ACTN|nr:DUF2786 domain-containing protein [Micromonospora polyrhachis]MBB4960342.1 hypothetical protein [Micromonospora polyrhachis]